ncbi:MAG: dTDP-4-dehydrorhamnose reductase [Nitrospirae bacterium]|nr:dTDP-4-dehydrorhamnose reductase [Nitrospirota bacterium]
MKVLITGSRGMLAQDLINVLRQGHEVSAPPEESFDITKRDNAYQTITEAAPDIVINCAAYTKVDRAEEERDKAFLINAIGVQNLALSCAEKKIPLCHISTDYVFDGEGKKPYTPFDNTNPISTYGESKLAGEKYIQWIMDKFYIVRTSWLYGAGGNNFVSTILRIAKERPEIGVVSDQTGSPTHTVSLSRAIEKLIKSGAYGIYHVTDETEGGISWFDFAKEIVSLSGLNTEVAPIPTEQYPTPAKRPKYSVLDMTTTRLAAGINPPSWKEELKEFF